MSWNRLKSFIEHVTGSAPRKLQSVEESAESGAFDTFEDLEYAESSPFSWIQYAARAVYYELASLIEYHLHRLAHEPWAASLRQGDKGEPEAEDVNMEEFLRG